MQLTSLSDIAETTVSHNPKIKKQVMLPYGLFPPLTNFSQARFPPGEIAHTHKHDDMLEVFFVQQGKGLITINGIEHALQSGDCIAVEPGEMHELKNISETDELVVTYFGIQISNLDTHL